MRTLHYVTGGTGLVGSALILQLSALDDVDVVCLLRGDRSDAESRLHRTLRRAARAYGTAPKVVESALRHIRVVPGVDLAREVSGLELPAPAGAGRVEFWHLAACMRFRESERRVTFATNVAGTRRALALADRAGTQVFNLISTAYVAGSAQGMTREEPVAVPRARNPYERSKIAAERLAFGARDFAVRVLRPSAIVGHSSTLAYPGVPSGACTVQRLVAAFHRSAGSGPQQQQRHRLLVREDGPLNLVPVDHVVREALEISRSGPPHGIFHLTNPTPPTVGDFVRACFWNAGGMEPEFVRDQDALGPDDRLLHEMLSVFLPYLRTTPAFGRERTDAALRAPAAAGWLPDPAALRRMFLPFAARPAPRSHRPDRPVEESPWPPSSSRRRWT
ncbi:SDR family oxidoreductase [Streptomyces sp. NBC_00690]|uniref:SDR family oxidoreductase n=1 Tax=Streptomyces sp. NBC_00690 TaxID=2975808 RepID=UPI002E29E4D8|nr:SDR family oxidoreductase [Streptomyces sp. NBC_00690]